MTRYAEIANFGLAGVSDDLLSLVSPSDANTYLDMSSSLADSYLGRRVNVPLLTWGNDLRQCVCRLAAYDLVSLNVGLTAGIDPTQSIWRSNYDLAIDWLEKVASGEITPEWIQSGVTGTSNGSRVKPKVYTKTTRGWGDLL